MNTTNPYSRTYTKKGPGRMHGGKHGVPGAKWARKAAEKKLGVRH